MEKKNWEANYSKKIDALEEMHAEHVERTNQFIDMVEQCDPDALFEVLMRISEYYNKHSLREERIQKEHDYPDFILHRKSHRALKKRILQFRSRPEDDRTILKTEIKEFLQYWLVTHILKTDKEYTPFVRIKEYLKASK